MPLQARSIQYIPEDISTVILPKMFEKCLDDLRTYLERLRTYRTPLGEQSPPSVPPAGLLCLPFEIRLQIYHYCIPRNCVIGVGTPHLNTHSSSVDRTLDFGDALDFEHDPDLEVDHDLTDNDAMCLEDGTTHQKDQALYLENNYWEHKNENSIFLLSKQTSEEALNVLYGDNIFKISLHGRGEYALKNNFTRANRQRMRYLVLIAQPKGSRYMPGETPDNTLWCSTLPQLKGLRIVAEQPVEAIASYNAPTLEQDVDRWVKWIWPFLECFGHHLSIETIVQVDINGRSETRELVKECLPHGHREIRCRYFGDFIFKRGRFSWESGYWDRISSHHADDDLYSD